MNYGRTAELGAGNKTVMKIIIKETFEYKTLSLIDPKTGIDDITDFIGNQGALSNGVFTFDMELDAYICTQETFEWWDTVVADHQELQYFIHELLQDHDSTTVSDVIHTIDSVDLEDLAPKTIQALKETFSSTK